MSERLYKFVHEDGTPMYGRGKWDLPRDGRPGRWRSVRGRLVPCEHGIHALRERDLIHWLGPVLYRIEHDGELLDAGDKVVVRRARLVRRIDAWNERTARFFACDCAERALSHVSEPDPRSVHAIVIARRYADGLATREELDAAWAAAEAAARDAAAAAARDAAQAAWAAAEAAARDAAAAAWAAAQAAAWASVQAAERDWQRAHLLKLLGLEATDDA